MPYTLIHWKKCVETMQANPNYDIEDISMEIGLEYHATRKLVEEVSREFKIKRTHCNRKREPAFASIHGGEKAKDKWK